MKTNTKSIFCVLLTILFLSPGVAKADELVRHNNDVNYGVESIIRHYNSNIDIVCDRHLGSPSFTMYIEGVPTVTCLDVDMYDVLDFEIFKNRVYFCGKYNNGNGTIGRIGFFNLTGFSSATNVQVYYFDVFWMKEVRALEIDIFSLLGTKEHLVVIGDGVEDEPIIVDFINEGSYWEVNSSIIYNDSLRLSDLTFTKSYVVVTSTMEKSHNREGILWYFLKPTTDGVSIFQSGYSAYEYIGTNFSPKVIVKPIEKDIFVIAHTPWSPNETPDFYLTKCNGTSVIDRYILSEPNSVKHPKLRDIATKDTVRDVHLLINIENNGTPCTIIYEALIYITSNVFPVFGHSYNGVYATSLSKRRDRAHFVASGFGYSNGKPYVLKYGDGAYGCGCLPTIQNTMRRISVDYTPEKIHFSRVLGEIVPVPYEKQTRVQNVSIDCYVQAKDPE